MHLIDYSEPWMSAQKALRKLHHSMLTKEYDVAIESGMKAIAEVRLAIAAVRHIKEIVEQDDGLRQ